MSILDRYIFKTAGTAFLGTLFSLTAVIWITQALREFDLLTAKRQTVLVFLTVTGLSIPALVTIIAPVSLFIAVLYALNKLNGDSELIVMSAAGLPPGRLLRPFLGLALLVAGLVAAMTLWAMPSSFRDMRDLVTKIRADFVSNIVREGQFTNLDAGITFHYRERSGESLLGIFMQDRRDPERTNTYIAERGRTVDSRGIPYLVLEQGSIQREQRGSADAAIVVFERYAIDLSQFGNENEAVVYKPRERGTPELLDLNKTDPYVQMQRGRFRAELHDRFSAPLYPLAFMAIAVAALGTARTTRQGRGLAIGTAIVIMVALRIAGFAVSSLVVRSGNAIVLAYLVPLAGLVGGLAFMFKGSFSLRRRRPAPALRPALQG
jgi:lipopolysaccharide export system permease protein